MNGGEGARGFRSRASGWATATPYRLPLAVAGVGLVLSAPFGGWRTAEPEGAPTVAVDEAVAAAPFEITVERAYHSPRPGDSFSELDPGQQYVVVLGTLTSHHDTTVDGVLFTEAVDVQGLPVPLDLVGNEVADGTQVEPLLYSAADSTPLRRLGPGLTYDIGLVYTTGSSELPQELTLRIEGHTWRASFFTQEEGWRDPAVVAQIVVPLTEQETPADPGRGAGQAGDGP